MSKPAGKVITLATVATMATPSFDVTGFIERMRATGWNFIGPNADWSEMRFQRELTFSGGETPDE